MGNGKAKSEPAPVDVSTRERGSKRALLEAILQFKKFFRKNLQAESSVLCELARLDSVDRHRLL